MPGRARERFNRLLPWLVYLTAAIACTVYLNGRAGLVPRWGKWYPVEPIVHLQVRAFLEGHTAIFRHPSGASHDLNWGRGGMHQAWGIGVALIAVPFYLVGRLFGAGGFPDDVMFLVLYGATTVFLARSIHGLTRYAPRDLGVSAAAAGAIMVFPTFVGMIASRFRIYEETIGIGALWDVALLAGVISMLHHYRPSRFVALCAAAGFAVVIRPPLAIYGLTTVAVAFVLAHRAGASWRTLLWGGTAFAATGAIFCLGNVLRFGSPFNYGYVNSVSGTFTNRLTRWGLSFARVPFFSAAKEMFAMLFMLDPLPAQIYDPPAPVRPYALRARLREYYAPTFDLLLLTIFLAAVVFAIWRIVSHRLWKKERPLEGEAIALLGMWALVPGAALFVFYTRVPQAITRYASDLYPAFAAASLCVGMTIVAFVRRRAPRYVTSTQIVLAGLTALYVAGWRGWVTHLVDPLDHDAFVARIAKADENAQRIIPAPDHFKCNEPRGPSPIYSHLDGWKPDCSFESGLVFAKQNSPCLTFTFAPKHAAWDAVDEQALAHLRVNADSDVLVSCGPASTADRERHITMCEPHTPSYLLDGMRLYAVASLDDNLEPIDGLKLMRIDSAPACQ